MTGRGARFLAVAVALLLAASAVDGQQPRAAGGQGLHPASAFPAMVVLVRHAEKAAQPADDPPLTEAGSLRAEALAATLRDAGVTAIITTQWQRTKATAAPLASARGLVPEVITAAGATADHAAAVAAAVRRHPGGVVLVVGHSDTVPAIVDALGGPRLPELAAAVFDDLFILVPTSAGPRLVHARYGAPSPR